MMSWTKVKLVMACITAAVVIGTVATSLALKALAQGDVYGEFNNFCIDNFGAEKEKLTYQMFGQDLTFVEEGFWVYESERSVCIGFETNLPAKTYVEYGQTLSYEYKTTESERHFYLHLHYLKNLAPDTIYHYRLVAIDERGNKIVSGDKTLMTRTFTNAVHIPDDMTGPPYILDQEGKTYVVTQDLTCDETAIEVKANNITLDLGGHTVIYDNVHKGSVGDYWEHIYYSSFGIKARKGPSGYITGFKVFNGAIKQGAGQDEGTYADSIGYSPMYFGGSKYEVAGVTIIWAGAQLIGIYCNVAGEDSDFHHSVFEDRGYVINNRHGRGCRALLFCDFQPQNTKVHHNLVKRTRQSGIGGSEIYHNEIYIDSFDTNSFGISPIDQVYGNRIFGTGYHVCAIGWNTKINVYKNYIHLQGVKPTERSPEYGAHASVNGIRLTQYSSGAYLYEDNLYKENVIVVKGREGSRLRGVQFSSDTHVKNLRVVNNIIKAIAQDQETWEGSCVVTQGISTVADQALPITYENNTYISNICNIRFGDSYSTGSNHHFINDRFVRVGDDSRYKTFIFGSGYTCKHHIIRDPIFEGGASLDSVSFPWASANHDFTVQWTLTIRTDPGANVVIKDIAENVVFSGEAGIDGKLTTPLSQYIARPSGKIFFTPHTVTVPKTGYPSKTETVNLTKPMELIMFLGEEGLQGDVNKDAKVDIKDLILVAKDFGKTSGFNPGCDINKDNKVDIKDLIIVAKNFGKGV